MKQTKDELAEQLRELLEKNECYQEALKIVKSNFHGKVWLIGGAVYKTLLFKNCNQTKDFDFIVESPNKEIVLPEGWRIKNNRFGTLKFVSEMKEIDFVPLKEVIHIKSKGLEATIENYLAYTPLNIHSIAYDIKKKKLLGEIGIAALEEKVIRVNDFEMASKMVGKYGISLREMLKNKAQELGFDYEL